jgi:hypothetical protein
MNVRISAAMMVVQVIVASHAAIPLNESRAAATLVPNSAAASSAALQAESLRDFRMVQYCVPPEEGALDQQRIFCRDSSPSTRHHNQET